MYYSKDMLMCISRKNLFQHPLSHILNTPGILLAYDTETHQIDSNSETWRRQMSGSAADEDPACSLMLLCDEELDIPKHMRQGESWTHVIKEGECLSI